MKKYWILIFAFIVCFNVFSQFADPFSWETQVNDDTLEVQVRIPKDHYLYKKSTRLTVTDAGNQVLTPLSKPQTILHNDAFSGEVAIYPSPSSTWKYSLKGATYPFKVNIEYQGCQDQTAESPASCFMPGEKTLTISKSKVESTVSAPETDKYQEDTLRDILDKFTVRDSLKGGADVPKFTAFLSGKNEDENFLKNKGVLLIIVIVLGGGLLLNFTPCVLPMIPINLAIIGAGSKADSKWSGFIRGTIYGLGITIAYGTLGLFAIQGSVAFGTLNSTAWFNFLIAIIFIILSLAMFGVFNIDFSQYSNRFNSKSAEKGKMTGIFFMGVVAALLAGACVAPVLIAVLLHSATVYKSGNPAGLLLPFLLGLGMGLPWSFAGAGLAVLPKPGKWMLHIKHIFGILIVAIAVYYGYIGYSLIPSEKQEASVDNQNLRFKSTLEESLRSGKPVLIDFWATWCGVCTSMAKTTLKDAKVKKALEEFIFFKYQAEKFNDPDTEKVLKYFEVSGLPTFIILNPKEKTTE